eukprot:TRINITY_DN11244_c0_g3_i1.p1 TRINITY_DN11244_c0_g3~~TRINITY_DN11244_c0_g3_i1.p1  ORF type:complete len:125 (+),score=30.02 TRINITY_DN11244_c0_g3_i1:69-443(+)
MGNCGGKKAQKPPKTEKPSKKEKIQPAPVPPAVTEQTKKESIKAASAAQVKEEALRSTSPPAVKDESHGADSPKSETSPKQSVDELLALATNAVRNMDSQHDREKAERDAYYAEREKMSHNNAN